MHKIIVKVVFDEQMSYITGSDGLGKWVIGKTIHYNDGSQTHVYQH